VCCGNSKDGVVREDDPQEVGQNSAPDAANSKHGVVVGQSVGHMMVYSFLYDAGLASMR